MCVCVGAIVDVMVGVALGPEGCTEEFVGGLPVYQGLELDVLQSLVVYFSLQTDPLISSNLGDLLVAILSEFHLAHVLSVTFSFRTHQGEEVQFPGSHAAVPVAAPSKQEGQVTPPASAHP